MRDTRLAPASPLGFLSPLALSRRLGLPLDRLLGRYVGAISLVSLFYAINMVLGLGRDTVLTARFGATEELAGLLLGLNFVRTAGLQIAVSVAGGLVPVLVLLTQDKDRDRYLGVIRRMLRDCLLVLVPVGALLALLADPLARALGPGLGESGLSTLRDAVRWLAPLLVLLGCAGLVKAISDSLGIYVAYPIALGLTTLGLVVGVLASPAESQVFGAIAGSVVGGGAGLLAGSLTVWRRRPGGWREPRSPGVSAAVGERVSLPYRGIALLLASSLVVQTQGVVQRAYASYLPAESIVGFSLALSVLGIPTVLLLPALASVLLPRFSRQEAAAKGRSGLSSRHHAILLVGFALVTAVLWLGSDLLVGVLFVRGRFTAEAAAQTAFIVRWLAPSLIAYVSFSVSRQVLLARRKTGLDLTVSVAMLLATIAFLRILVPAYGISGLIGAILLCTFLNAVLYFWLSSLTSRGTAHEVVEADRIATSGSRHLGD